MSTLTVSRTDNPWARGANTRRAQQLLAGGFILCNAVGLTCVGISWVVAGPWAAVSAAVCLAVVLLFFTIGQGVQVMMAEADPRQILFAALASYALRAGALAALLYVALAHLGQLARVDRTAVMATTLLCVAAWVGGEILAYRRLRIPVFDTEYRPAGKDES